MDGDGVHSPRLNHSEKRLSLKARPKEGHKVDRERSDNNALVIGPIQGLKKCITGRRTCIDTKTQAGEILFTSANVDSRKI